MSRASEEAYVSETRPSTDEPSGASPSSTTINLNILRQPRGMGSAVALTVGASLATLIYMRRRRGRHRMRRLAWLAVRATLIRTLVPKATRGAVTFGGVLVAAVLLGRLRQSRSHSNLEELTERVAALQAEVDARGLSRRPRPRDMVIGAALGLVFAVIIGRLASRRQASLD